LARAPPSSIERCQGVASVAKYSMNRSANVLDSRLAPRDDLLLPDRTEDVDPCTPHRHGKLKGSKRCFGCGRTRNEIEIEEGA
jgi:hypothetical protein